MNTSVQNEYVIWGVAPGTSIETLLVSEKANIKSEEQAQNIVDKLINEHGCTSCRIQVFNLNDPFEWEVV